jgi:hypothetical protein
MFSPEDQGSRFGSALDVDEVILVDGADVSGVQPSIDQNFPCGILIFVVTIEDLISVDQDFSGIL